MFTTLHIWVCDAVAGVGTDIIIAVTSSVRHCHYHEIAVMINLNEQPSRSSCRRLHHNAIDNIMKSGSSSISERRWQRAANLRILPSTYIATQHYHSSLSQIWLLCTIVAVVVVFLSGLPLRLASCWLVHYQETPQIFVRGPNLFVPSLFFHSGRKPYWKKCPIALILYMPASVDPTSWRTYPKTVIVLHRLFNNTHNINYSIH